MANIRMKTNRLKKGMVISSDVYTRSGVVLVPENTVVTKEVYDLLTRHFIDEVTVEYEVKTAPAPTPASAPPTPRIDEKKLQEFTKTYKIAEETLSQNLKDIVNNDKDVDIASLLDLLHSIINKSDGDLNLCDLLFNMQHSSETLYSHSINVSLYAQLLGRWVNFTREEIELVSLAGLLHDIGHLKYPDADQQSFSLHEGMIKACHEQHPTFGYRLVQHKNVDFRIKQAILTHHERMDKSGFPLGVSFNNLNSIARAIAIADSYVTLITEEYGHPALTPFEALKKLQENDFNKYDSRYLMTFIDRIAQNYIQHEVLLSNGQTGVIIMLNKTDLTRPLVQIGSMFLDLALQTDISIKKILN